jgi:hypothetical protein
VEAPSVVNETLRLSICDQLQLMPQVLRSCLIKHGKSNNLPLREGRTSTDAFVHYSAKDLDQLRKIMVCLDVLVCVMPAVHSGHGVPPLMLFVFSTSSVDRSAPVFQPLY